MLKTRQTFQMHWEKAYHQWQDTEDFRHKSKDLMCIRIKKGGDTGSGLPITNKSCFWINSFIPYLDPKICSIASQTLYKAFPPLNSTFCNSTFCIWYSNIYVLYILESIYNKLWILNDSVSSDWNHPLWLLSHMLWHIHSKMREFLLHSDKHTVGP